MASRALASWRRVASTDSCMVLRPPTEGVVVVIAWRRLICCCNVDAPRMSGASGGVIAMSSATVAASTRDILPTSTAR